MKHSHTTKDKKETNENPKPTREYYKEGNTTLEDSVIAQSVYM